MKRAFLNKVLRAILAVLIAAAWVVFIVTSTAIAWMEKEGYIEGDVLFGDTKTASELIVNEVIGIQQFILSTRVKDTGRTYNIKAPQIEENTSVCDITVHTYNDNDTVFYGTDKSKYHLTTLRLYGIGTDYAVVRTNESETTVLYTPMVSQSVTIYEDKLCAFIIANDDVSAACASDVQTDLRIYGTYFDEALAIKEYVERNFALDKYISYERIVPDYYNKEGAMYIVQYECPLYIVSENGYYVNLDIYLKDGALELHPELAEAKSIYEKLYPIRSGVKNACTVSFALLAVFNLLAVIAIRCFGAKNKNSTLSMIPLEVFFVTFIGACVFILWCFTRLAEFANTEFFIATIAIAALLAEVMLYCIALRHNTILTLEQAEKSLSGKAVPIGVKAAISAVAYIMLCAALVFYHESVVFVGVWVIATLTALLLMCDYACQFDRVCRELENKNTGGSKGVFSKLKALSAIHNKMDERIDGAVSELVKSERMKTELITNVSHDIKTPLTSIVNYTELLSKEKFENETARGYISVLSKQAVRMKRLVEDLVEAAKASSGSIKPDLARIDVNQLLEQATAEYEDKLLSAHITPVLEIKSEDISAIADGRLLWRVIDNLLSNICKYALPGTRAYIGAQNEQDSVLITVKNISANKLNISPDELMERFVRGDESRSTEGSGLGLSIAKSLTEIQKGEFSIEIDGDLFKAHIRLPKVEDTVS